MFNCEYCGKEFEKPVTSGHKRKCPEFLSANPDRNSPPCLCGHESTSLTQMKRHRQRCDIWGARDKNATANERIKKTFTKKYGEGVTNPIQIPGSLAKKAKTMKERYGAENRFSRESSLFGLVQSHWDGKDRTAHLPKDNFARPEIKEKIRDYWIKNHGVVSGSQVPEIRAKQLATTLARYGDEQGFRVPSIRAKGCATMMKLYGFHDAAQSPEIQKKISQTNSERYGVPWTTVHTETREKQYLTQIKNFGSLFFASEQGKKIVQDSFPERQAKIVATNLIRFGAPHFMQNPILAAEHLSHSRRAGPNSIEQIFQQMFPRFLFTGDGTYWRYLPLLGQNKNPDFVLTGPNPDSPFHESRAVVEIFGDYWHGESKTGKPAVVHESETIAAWGEVGMKCLVVWENEFKDVDKISERVQNFLL